MAHHHHHQHHHHAHGERHAKTIGEHNKEHYDSLDPNTWQVSWIKQLTDQITDELQQQTAWIGIDISSKDSERKMLDYACGNGTVSQALEPLFPVIRGMDISSGMSEQYNTRAAKNGLSHKMHAVHADLLDPASTSFSALNTPEFQSFDLIAMSMALHHVSDPSAMVRELSQRLRSGGVLLIVDWVAPEESGCASPRIMNETQVKHTISRMGFEEAQLKRMFDDAGLVGWGWKWLSVRTVMPDEFGGEQQLFFARGVKA